MSAVCLLFKDNDDEDSDEDDESGTEISDSFEDIDASGASEAVMTGIPTGVPMPMIEIFKVILFGFLFELVYSCLNLFILV